MTMVERTGSATMAFRRLSHTFSVRCDDPVVGDYVSRVLHRFAAEETSETDHAYEVLDLGQTESRSRYRLLVEGEPVIVSGNPARVLNDLFARVNLNTVEAARELVLVHAGAVVAPKGLGIVLPAPSGAGKTTLVAGLVRAGFGYLSDEAAVFNPETGTLLPYPTHLSLKGKSCDQFHDAIPSSADLRLSEDVWQVDPDAIRPGAVASPCGVGFVIPHRHEQGRETRIEPITPAVACTELSRNLMMARRDAARSLDLLARVCRNSRCYYLISGDLDEAVEAIGAITS